MAPTNRLIEARRAEFRAQEAKHREQIGPANAKKGAKTDDRPAAKPKAETQTRAS